MRTTPISPEDCAATLALLGEAAAAHRSAEAVRNAAHIPLERVELELARVVRIELAGLLLRAHALCLIALRAGAVSRHPGADPAAGAGAATPDPLSPVHTALVRALQRDVAEVIDVARTSEVPVPRVVRRLIAGGVATWPAPARIARWAERLDPCAALASVAVAMTPR